MKLQSDLRLVAARAVLEVLGRGHAVYWGHLLFVSGLGLFSGNYIPGQDWLPLMPGLWPPDGSYNESWIWLPLLLGLGHLAELKVTLRPVAASLGFVDLWDVLEKSAAQTR